MLTLEQVKQWVGEVPDPEIPVLTIEDLGILRGINYENNEYKITITPTYTGCPAMKAIENNIAEVLSKHNINNYFINTVLSPAWTTDWMSEEGKIKLEAYGIAPPQQTTANKKLLLGQEPEIPCPRCKSKNSRMISQFGSTACKSLWQCNDCLEPFDYFKCL